MQVIIPGEHPVDMARGNEGMSHIMSFSLSGILETFIRHIYHHGLCYVFLCVSVSLGYGFVDISFAGDHKPLCRKVTEADLVFEMAFEINEKYDDNYRKKGWAPPDSVLMNISRSGKITKVFKGNAVIGDPWIDSYGILFRQGTSVKRWEAFFQRKRFRMIAFLVKSNEGYTSTGWAEERAGCRISSHYSWCRAYPRYKSDVADCVKKEAESSKDR